VLDATKIYDELLARPDPATCTNG